MSYGTTNTLWRVRLFDGPVLESADGKEIHRFRSHKVGALLAYLALHLGHPCPRETLYTALWPEEDDLKVVANRLRVVLTSLRHQLEPSGIPYGTVLDVSAFSLVRLRPETVWCDLAEFEIAWKAGRTEEAARLVRGPLLPGFYEEWVLTEQARFELLRDDLELTESPACEEEEAVSMTATAKVARSEIDASKGVSDFPEHRLPLYLTRFFGREEEIRQLRERLDANRFVSLTGPGGIGKTRLAVETARQMPSACIFVPLAELSDFDRVPEAILQALRISTQVDADPVLQLIEVLQYRTPLLLILDNVEHLIEPVASLGLHLLEELPGLHLLITSRQRLDLPGEVLFALPPLEPPQYVTTPERLLEFPAVALFLDRAQHARPDFTFTARHADALVEICRRLEGVPLALELAAARVTAQSPVQIVEALAKSLMDLKSRQRSLSKRHQSLRAAIQGSYDLLPPDLQRYFALLSVFQGGWTAEAARFVTDCAEAEEWLEELVVRSMVEVREESGNGVMRYTFLETLRQFAVEQLSEEERTVCAQRHRDYYLALAARVREEDIESVIPLDAEHQNLLIALEHGDQLRDAFFWKGLSGVLLHAFLRGHHRFAVRWIDATFGAVATIPDHALRLQLRYAACMILPDIGRPEETERLALEMQSDAEANDDPVGIALAGCILGYVEEIRGETASAVSRQREALRQARLLNSTELMQICLSHTSGALHAYGVVLGPETEEGRLVLQEAEALAREFRMLVPPRSRRSSLAPSMIAAALMFQNRQSEAYHFLKETQRACIALGTTAELMYCLIYECEIAAERELYPQAAQLYGAFLALQERMGYSLARAESFRPAWIQKLSSRLQEQLGEETFALLVRLGRQTPPEKFAAEELPLAAIAAGD